MLELLRYVIITGYAVICACEDYRKRCIDIRVSAAVGITGCIICALLVFQNGAAVVLRETALAMMPGIIIIALSYLSNGAVGIGDGIFFLVYGLYMNIGSVTTAVMTAWSIAAITGLCMLVADVGRRKRNRTIPFVTAALPAVLFTSISALRRAGYGI